MSNFPLGDPSFVGDVTNLKFTTLHTVAGPKGTVSRYSVFCPNVEVLTAYAQYITQSGATIDFVGPDLGTERDMTVELPGIAAGVNVPELFFDQWELLTNEASDTIFADPQLITPQPALTLYYPNPVLNYNDKVVLSRVARTGDNITNAVTDCNTDISTGNLPPPLIGTGPRGGGGPNTGLAGTPGQFQAPGLNSPKDAFGGFAPTQIYHELKKGQAEYGAPTYVLRHTSYCSPGASYNTSIAHTYQIYTPAALLSEIASGWTYNCPFRLLSKISQIPVQFAAPEESPYYTWGWLKKITRETQMANFMVEVAVEYECALWSSLRYAIR